MFRFHQKAKHHLFLLFLQSRRIPFLTLCPLFIFLLLVGKPPGLIIAGLITLIYTVLASLFIKLLPDLLLLVRTKYWIGVLVGLGLFTLIAVPANAAIFDTAERYTTEIFGQYIDSSMIKLIFGFLRISAFLIGAAFVLLALEKARHGENWQPFAWNAFAVLMVVVLVEGMSSLFLSTTASTPSSR